MLIKFEAVGGPCTIEVGYGMSGYYLSSKGYRYSDTVNTAVATEEERAKFYQWHHHEEDEVRTCLSVEEACEFSFKTKDGVVTLLVEASDWLIIPKGSVHRFRGRGIFLRNFKSNDGWEPIYE